MKILHKYSNSKLNLLYKFSPTSMVFTRKFILLWQTYMKLYAMLYVLEKAYVKIIF